MAKELKLYTGASIPTLGFGTWKSKPNEVATAVEEALNAGYRHIDCAALYGNEKEIGEVFKKFFSAGKIERKDIFVTSKLWNTDWGRVQDGLKKTLSDLQLDYLDLYLVHTPCSFEYDNGNTWPTHPNGTSRLGNVPVHKMWQEMEKCVDLGLTKHIGVSNFPVVMIHDLLCYARIKPAVQQLEVHPYFQQRRNIEYCLSQGMQITAYSPLANGKEGPLSDPVVTEIAKKSGATPAQVLIRWSINKGYTVIPKSVTSARIRENFNVFGFEISDDDMKKMDGLERGFRTCDLSVFWNWPLYD